MIRSLLLIGLLVLVAAEWMVKRNVPAASLTALLRSNNEEVQDHFYTANPQEQRDAVQLGYAIEGQMGFIENWADPSCTGLVPFYRMWSSSANDHFYTTNFEEMLNAKKWYNLEGIVGYCMTEPASGLVPLHRFWSKSRQDHFYTNDENEKNVVQQAGVYSYEGIQCYVWQSIDNARC